MRFLRFPAAIKNSASHAVPKRILSARMDRAGISSLEKLEPRLTLSVTVKAVNGSILISGDAANNHVGIIQDGGGNLFIYGDTNTSISGDGVVSGVIPDTNAGGGREFNSGLFSQLVINLGDGNDTLEIAGLRGSDVKSLTIDTGNATTGDTVRLQQTTFLGNPDTNWGGNSVAQSVSITTGNGADLVQISDLSTPALSVRTGAGADTIGVTDIAGLITYGSALIDGGAGADTFAFGGGGQQLDLRMLNSSRFTQIESVDLTGSGNNTLTLDANTVLALLPDTKTLLVNGDAGDTTAIGAGWDAKSDETIGLTTYAVFAKDGATLKVAKAVTLDAPTPQVFTVDARHPLTFADANHDAVTVKLTGKGTALVTLHGGVAHDADISNIVLSESDVKTTVSVTVKKDKLTGDGFTTIGGITEDSPLKSFTAKTTSLNDSGFASTEVVKSLAFRDLLSGQITTGGAATDKLALTLGAVAAGTTITSPEAISTLTATSIDHATIMADAIGAINVKAGTLGADIASTKAIGKITVKGGGLSGDLTAANFGPVSITGGDFSGSLTALTLPATLGATKALASLTVTGGDITGDIRVLGQVGTISVKAVNGAGGNLNGATIVAEGIATLNVARDVNQALVLAGADLGADHAFGGGNDTFSAGVLGTVKIVGNVTGASVIAAGLSSTDGTLKNGEDTIVDGIASVIKKFSVGMADADSYFVAGLFKTAPKIGGLAIDPTMDGRFLTVT